ncbi:MAG: cytochrome-c peroxidase [Bernardetiaceae bacterium]|nr:cytochrome-c peroxidase [Bernardetiaceae bacterium]
MKKPISKIIFMLFASSLLYACGGSDSEQASSTGSSNEALNKGSFVDYDEKLQGKMALFKPLPDNSENPNNVYSDAKLNLGHALFFDKRLSKNNTISCNSCHNLATFGVDNEPTSPGDAGERGPRNSPTVLNVSLHSSQFWDGRAKDVEEQAGMPILNPIEMAIPNEQFLVDRLKKIPMYQSLFKEAYPDEKDPLTYENITKALGLFERQLLTPTRFDDYLKGDKNALTKNEKKGMLAFIEAGCGTCHNGPLLGGTMFQKFGTYGDYAELTKSKTIDKGRFEVTGNESDMFMFKVPTLRNVEKTGPYFHDGSVASLEESVKIMAKLQLDKELSDEEVASIVEFMKALTGEVPLPYKEVPEILQNEEKAL